MPRVKTGLRVLLFVFAWVGLAVPAFATPAQLIFGAKQYTRTTGAPNQFTDTITVPTNVGAPFQLHIVNGQSNGQNRISSAWIEVNNVQVAGPSDFGQNVAVVDRTITLNPGTNQLKVRLASTPGAFLTVYVYSTKILPTPTALTPNPLSLTVGSVGTLTATISPAPTTAGSLSLSSNNTGVATVPSSVPFAVNQTGIAIPVTAVAIGNAQITATLNDGSVSATVDVSAAPPTIASLQPSTETITQGGNGTLTVTISAAQSSATNVTLSSSASGIASVPASVTVPAGQTTKTIPVSANTPGTAVITTSLNSTSATSTITVTANLPKIVSLVPPTTSLNLGATGTLTVTISAVQASATPIPVTVAPTGIVTVPATVSVPAGQLTTTIPVTAAALGTAMVHVSLNGTMAESAVQVTPPPPAIVSLLPSPLPVVVGANGTLIITLNAGQLTNTEVSLTVTPSSIVQVPAIVTVPAGQTSASFTVNGLAVGNATATAMLDGTTKSATVQVQPPPPTVVSLLPNPLPLQQGATGSLTLMINAAQVSDTVITLTNSASTILQVPASITVPANQLSAVIPVTALLAGSATITASINSSTVSSIVQVTPPPPVVASLTTIPPDPPGTVLTRPKGKPGTLRVTLSRVPSEVTLVTLESSATNVAVVPASVTVAAGSLTAEVPVNAVGEGTATITASHNGGSATATVTVTAPELVLLTLSPQDPTLFVGETQPMTATATLTDGTTQNLTTDSRLVWVSTSQTVATITTDGLVSALAVGASTIRATFTPMTGQPTIVETSLTVLTPPALTLTATPTTLAVGQALSVTVTSARVAGIGGLPVTITSSGTGAVSYASTVTILENQTSISFVVTGVTPGLVTLTATAPIRTPGTLTLAVNPGAAPVFLGMTPLSGPTGTVVTLIGLNFFPQGTDTVVRLNGLAVTLMTVNPTQLSFAVPAGATSGLVAVTTPLGTATSPQPFLINRSAVLDPIGNKTVALGSTLTFTATAVDPDGQPLTLAATPMPLMPHATFTTQTGLFVFTPDATQVGTFPLTISASDGIVTVSESITITVTGASPGGATGLSGRVVDGSGQPIANMVVTVKGTGQTGTTNAQGIFTINGVTATGRQVLLANGAPLGYAILAAPVDLIPNVMNNLSSELRVPVVDTAHAVTVNPVATTVISNPTLPNTTVTIVPGTAKNADGTNFTGALSISPVPEYGRPESRPVELKPGFSITIQPAGITMVTPAPITLPNTDNLPPGNELDLWSLSPDTGTFYVAGRMRVSADGSKLETLSGGVQKTAWHFALAPGVRVPNGQNSPIGGGTQCPVGSSCDLTEGTLTQEITIPGVRTLGVSRDLTLHYTSTTADVRRIIPVQATLDVSAAVPQTFSADVTVGGLKQGSRGIWDATVMNEIATSSTRFGVQLDGGLLSTGLHPYELVTYSNYTQSSIGTINRGFTAIRNEQQSPFGAGWTLAQLDRLVVTSGETVLLASGNGRTIPFVSASTTNLVSWWPADGSGVDVRGGNTAVLTNGATYAVGQVGQAFALDGIDDYVRVAHTPTLDPSGSFTIAAWIQTTLTATRPNQVIVSKSECGGACPAGATATYQFVVGVTGHIHVNIRESSAASGINPQVIVGGRPLADGQFHHVAFVRDMTARELRLYVDGQLDAQQTLTDAADGPLGDTDGEPDPFIIGAVVQGGAQSFLNFFKGTIDEVEFYARAVPQPELNAVYISGGRRDVATDFIPALSEYSSLKRNTDGTYTRILKDGTTYQFNAQGYQTSMADRNGNLTTYAYNASNQLATITDPVAQVTTFSYSGTRLATITDSAGRVTTLTHDSDGNLIVVEGSDQTRTSFNYDAQHHMVQKRDAQGQVYAYQFDFVGRLKKALLPNGDSREIRPTELIGVPDLANGVGVPGNPAPVSQPSVIQATLKDAKGQTIRFETDAIGRITKQIDPLNRTTLIDRDPQGNPTRIQRPNGAITTMTYDTKGNLLSSTDESLSATTTFTYEPTFNQVKTIRDPKGNLTTIDYDAKGNPLTITDADNKITRFFYNAQGLLTETRDALYPTNPATTFTYDTLGRLLTTTDPLNRTSTLTYDAVGNVATSKDALDRVTSFEYDAKNRLRKVTDSSNGVTQYTYDGNGNLLTVKDAKNHTTTFAYDGRNRLISTTDPLGKVETYEYDGNDNLTKRHTPKGDDILFAYDAVNQLLNKTLPGNQVTNYVYDLVGNLTSVTDPDSALTMTYDLANRLATVKTDGSSHQPAVTLSSAYDKNGNRLTLTDSQWTTRSGYDALNRLISLSAAPGTSDGPPPPSLPPNALAYWPAEGTAIDPVGGQNGTLQNGTLFVPGRVGQAFQFDGDDDYVNVPDSAVLDSVTTAITVEAWIKPEPSSLALTTVFARRNPFVSEGFSVFLRDNGALDVRVQTNTSTLQGGSIFVSASGVIAVGQFQHVAVTADTTTGLVRAYVNGVLISLTRTFGPSLSGTFVNSNNLFIGQREGNELGGPESGAHFRGAIDEVVLYSRALTQAEIQSRMQSAPTTPTTPTAPSGPATTFTYDALSRRTSMTLPNGVQTTYSYDPASQVTNILHQIVSSATQINQAAYAYNPVGNRTSLTDRRGPQAFGYDNLDRLTSASHPLLGTPQAFAYDPVGNRTTGGSVVNAGNQLTADATHSYQYDDNGNLTRKTLLATGNYTQYTYDPENRLTKVEEFVAGNPTAAFTSTYRYDGLGRRIEKVANGQTKRYIYDGEDMLLEYDGSNVLQARYTHGPGIDEPIAVTKGGSTSFYHQDGLGSVTDLTDSAGATAKSYSYDAYGTIVESPGTLEQPYTYTAREFDSESGLYYYRARYYDPATGRFLQPDPGPAGLNSARLPRHPLDLVSQYIYASNNPIRLIDPLGTDPQEPGGVGIDACKYYDDVARMNGCKYHPYAKDYCLNPKGNPCIRNLASAGTINVIRQELIIEDQKARIDRSTEACDTPGCATAQAVTAYHKKVFAAHGIPEWCFPSWWLPMRGTGDQ